MAKLQQAFYDHLREHPTDLLGWAALTDVLITQEASPSVIDVARNTGIWIGILEDWLRYGPAIVAELPIRRICLLDKTPSHCVGLYDQPRWVWIQTRGQATSSYLLPSDFFTFAPFGHVYAEEVWDTAPSLSFYTCEEAWNWLTAVAVAWACEENQKSKKKKGAEVNDVA